MMDIRHARLSLLGVEVYVASDVKENRHASLYPASRNRDTRDSLPRLRGITPYVCQGGRAPLEHGQNRLHL